MNSKLQQNLVTFLFCLSHYLFVKNLGAGEGGPQPSLIYTLDYNICSFSFRSYANPTIVSPPATPRARSETEDDYETTDVDSTSVSRSTAFTTSTAQPSKKKGPSSFELDSSHYMGIDAVKKLRMHYNVNKVLRT